MKSLDRLFALGANLRFAVILLLAAWCVSARAAGPVGESGSAGAAAVGEVVLAAGEVWRLGKDRSERGVLTRGDALFAGDTLQTGQGQLVARMLDGGVLSIRPQTRAVLNEYRGEGPGQSAAIRITIEHGTLRGATGTIGEAQKSKFRVNTPFSALGIRGTDFVTFVEGDVQVVAVSRGAIVLAPFDQASGCGPETLGSCAGAGALELAASTNESLRLERSAPRPSRLPGVPDILRARDSEQDFFAGTGARLAVSSLSGGRDSAVPAYETPVRDGTGREIRPYDSVVARASFRHGADFAADSNSVGRYYAEQLLRNQMLQASAPIAQREGILQVRDLAVVTPWDLYWFDRTASPVDAAVVRLALADIESRLDTYRLGAFGSVGLYSARAQNGLSMSVWLDPAGQRLWGRKEVVSSLMALRSMPEAATIWGVLPHMASAAGSVSRTWMEDVSAQRAPLWILPLDQQAIVHAAPGSDNRDDLPGRVFQLQFQQRMRAAVSETLTLLGNPEFGVLVRQGASFSLYYTLGGQLRSLSGAASSEGSFFAADDSFQARGQRTGDALLIMVSRRDGGNQWMLGYADPSGGPTGSGPPTLASGAVGSGLAAVPFPAVFETPSGSRWGRWSHFAQLSEGDARRLLGDVPLVSNSHFTLEVRPTLGLPSQGRFDFALGAYEAVYVKAGQLRPADVSNASLNVDLDKARFATRFEVRAPGTDIFEIRGQGTLSAQGQMRSLADESNARLEGVLGQGARSASLLFERSLGRDERVSGITHWTR